MRLMFCSEAFLPTSRGNELAIISGIISGIQRSIQRAGKFMESDASDIAANVGWRMPITNGRDESGYFMGFFVGNTLCR